jgi:2-furoyl-CoA dehydrogenase large subunit
MNLLNNMMGVVAPIKRGYLVGASALLIGRARFADDLPTPRGTLHAAVLRSPHGHAEILSIDLARALAMPGIECIVTGEDAQRWTRPFTAAVTSPIEYWCLATDRIRYAGEPVAVVLASAP